MRKYAIIVAGGVGTRMKSEVPKQFLEIEGVPILVHSIRKFLAYDPALEIIVVLPEKHLREWGFIQSQFFSNEQSIKATTGGLTRSTSVLSGLSLITEKDSLVAIHDAVRPFVSVETIRASYASAEKNGSGVAVVALKDSIREWTGGKTIARDRSNYVLVQTPQTFRTADLMDAYQKAGAGIFTDDASVFEAAGYDVFTVDGSYDNIKITTPEDLK